MKKDEFNEVKIINEGENPSFEFGNTPESESFSYRENKDGLRDEVNDNRVENSSNSKKEEEQKKEKKENQDNKSDKHSGSSSGASSSAATASVAAAAAACIVVGIVSIGATPITPEVENVKLTPHETSIECVFDIYTGAISNKYRVELYNDEFEDRHEKECQIGHNELEFTDLFSSTEYTFEIFKGVLNEQSEEYDYTSIYSSIVSTLDLSGPVQVSFDSDGREGTMNSIEIESNSEYTLPVSIFVPSKDEYFGGWKVNGEGEKLQPGDTVVIKNNTVLKAAWDKFPTQENTVTANKTFFSYFPEQATAVVSSVTIMDIEFQYSTVAYSSNEETLNMYVYDAFISTTTPFAGPIKSITVNSKTVNYDLTMVYSESPIYERVTEGGETQTIEFAQDYTFECTNPDARYFCLSRDNNADASASFASMKFVYETPVIENEFQVYFDANGGTGSFGPYTVRNTNQEQLPDIETIGFTAPHGYEFAGWKIKGLDDLLAPGTTVGISSDITLVAQWQPAPEYTVTFNSNGGSPVDPQTIVKGDQAARPEDPTREGYIFVDWYIDEELTTPYNFESAITDDLELFAGWKPDADFSMYINYIDTLSTSPTNELSFKYTKKDEHSLFVSYNLELSGDTTITKEVDSLDDVETYTTKTVQIDGTEVSALGTGIINYTMKGVTSDGESYDLATGSLSMNRTQKDYVQAIYIADKELQADNTGQVFPALDIGTPTSSTYYLPLRFDYSDFNKTHGSSDWRLAYSLDGSSYTNTTFSYSGGTANVSISKNLFDETTKQVTFAKIYFKDQSEKQIGSIYENVTLQASDERYVGGFQLNASYLVNPSNTPTFRLIACGERGTNPDNVNENYSFMTLGVNEDGFEALLSFKLLSKGGNVEKEYTINVVPYLKNNATSSMTTTNVEFEFIDVASGEDKREEFIELSKRYVVDVELTITPAGGTTFVCKGYESYSFR